MGWFGWEPAVTGIHPTETSFRGSVRYLLGGNYFKETSRGNQQARDFILRELYRDLCAASSIMDYPNMICGMSSNVDHSYTCQEITRGW